MMGCYNARLIYPIGYSRRRCGATAALIRQPQTHPHNEEPEIRNRILWEGVRFYLNPYSEHQPILTPSLPPDPDPDPNLTLTVTLIPTPTLTLTLNLNLFLSY